MEKLKKYVKTFVVPLATFGVLTMGKFSPTASAHELIFDFGGREIVASYFNFLNGNFANLVQTIDIDQTELAIRESLSDAEVSFRIAKNTKWVLVVENGSIDTRQFRIFLENLTFPLKVIFKNIKGELGFPSENFAAYGTIEFLNCGGLTLTQSFLSEMQGRYNTTDGIELKETLRNELLGASKYSVFLGDNSKFWESKADNDEQAFHTEEPKEEEDIIEKNIRKASGWVSKNGGPKGSVREFKKDLKYVVRSVRSGKSLKKAFANAFKIKEMGYKKK